MLEKTEGKVERRAEDEMVGWHHQLNGHEFVQTLGDRRTEEPGVLQSMGLQRVGCNGADQQEPQQRTKQTLYPQGKDDWELRVGGIRRDLWQRFRKVCTPD